MKGIVGYHLINVAAFRYSKCNVDGHCQFIGHNGNGKTTNLRVPLYFYNPSGERRDHAIESSKHSFNEFYFNGERSFIVYEICRGQFTDGVRDLYHIAVNRRSGAPRFIFIDAPFDKTLFENANGHICNERELIGNLQVAGIKSESVSTYEAYRSVIYGVDYHERFKRFVYAFPKANAEKHIRTIPKILSAIFRAENSKTETLKDALIASLGEEEASIDLRQTGKEMKQFNRDRNELMVLEAQLERIRCICNDYAEYKDHRADLSNIINRVHQCLPRAEHCLNMESVSIRTLEADLSRAKGLYQNALEVINGKIEECTRLEGSLNETINAIREIQQKYPEAKLKAWEQSERDIPNLKQKFEVYEAKLKARSKHYEDIQEKYQVLEEKVRASYDKLRNKARETYQLVAVSCTEQIGFFQHESSVKLTELRESFDSKRSKLNEDVTELHRDEVRLKQVKSSLRLDDFRGEVIKEQQIQLTKLRNTSATNETESKSLLEKHKAIGSQRDSTLLQIGKKYDTRILQWEREVENQQAAIEKLLPIIERYNGSLLETIDIEAIHPDVFRSVVNETVLLQRSDSILKSAETSPRTALLGLHIDTESLPKPAELNLESAKQEFSKLKLERDALLEKISIENGKKHEDLDELEAFYQQELRDHQEYANHVRSESRRILSEIEICQETLDYELRSQKQEFESKLKSLETEYRSANQALIKAEQERKEFNTSCAAQEKALQEQYNLQIESTRRKQRASADKRDSDISCTDKRLKEALVDLNREKTDELKAGSNKPDEIDRLKELVDDAISKLDAAQSDSQELIAYRKHSLSTVEKLPQTIASLQKNESEKKALEVQLESEAKNWQRQEIEINDKLKGHRERYEKSHEDIQAFKGWDFSAGENVAVTTETSVFNYAPGDIQKLLTQYQQTNNRMRDLWGGKPDTRTSQIHDCGIKSNVDYLVSRFGHGNRFSFPSSFEADESIREFIDYKLSVMLSTDSLDKERKQVLEAFRLTMRNLSREYQQLEDSKTRLSRILTAIQKSIASDGIFVASINSIEFDLQSSKTRTGALRDTLKVCLEKLDPTRIDLDTVQSDLFAQKPSQSEIVSLMDQVEAISNEVNDHNIERIRLGDLVDFVIRITENGIPHGWKPLVQGVGSEGTGALAKFIIYSGILSHFKKAVYKNADELHLHCTIDEIGKIYAGYVTELLNYCRKLGIYLATAQPNTHSKPGDFERTFIIDRNEKTQRARVTPVYEVTVRIR